jgi:hypothetical protein
MIILISSNAIDIIKHEDATEETTLTSTPAAHVCENVS